MLNARRLRAATLILMAGSASISPTPAWGIPSAPAQGDVTSNCLGGVDLSGGCGAKGVAITVRLDGRASAVSLSEGGSPTCARAGVSIACSLPDGAWWSASRGCYVRQSSPQPPLTSPLWEGHADGAIYECASGKEAPARPSDAVGWTSYAYQFWAATSPVSTVQIVQLAARATSSLGLSSVSVGMAPTPTSVDANSIGIVGLPNWMWVKNPSPTTWGPVTDSASDGGVTVTVTAKVEKVTWDMGDGTPPIVCGAGTPYYAAAGKDPSPTCGHAGYQQQGTYPVRAVSHWVIDYTSNVGVSGSLSTDLTASASVTVGELQTVVVHGG